MHEDDVPCRFAKLQLCSASAKCEMAIFELARFHQRAFCGFADEMVIGADADRRVRSVMLGQEQRAAGDHRTDGERDPEARCRHIGADFALRDEPDRGRHAHKARASIVKMMLLTAVSPPSVSQRDALLDASPKWGRKGECASPRVSSPTWGRCPRECGDGGG